MKLRTLCAALLACACLLPGALAGKRRRLPVTPCSTLAAAS